MRVIACFPEIAPDVEPTPAPVPEPADHEPVPTASQPVAIPDRPRLPLPMPAAVRTCVPLHHKVLEGPPRSAGGVRFPVRSVILLSLLAASSWAGAWWNDHQRLRAERTLAADAKRSEGADRPNRLARELPATGPAAEAVVP